MILPRLQQEVDHHTEAWSEMTSEHLESDRAPWSSPTADICGCLLAWSVTAGFLNSIETLAGSFGRSSGSVLLHRWCVTHSSGLHWDCFNPSCSLLKCTSLKPRILALMTKGRSGAEQPSVAGSPLDSEGPCELWRLVSDALVTQTLQTSPPSLVPSL